MAQRSIKFVVLVDTNGDGTGTIDVCCGKAYSTLAAAKKEADQHTGEGWIAVAEVKEVGYEEGWTWEKA